MSLDARGLPPVSLGSVLQAALIAGLAAGLTVAIFHLVVTEPLIDQAIAIEEQSHSAEGAHGHEAPLVSRDTQYKGLVVGYVIFGLTWALLFGVSYQLAQRWLPARSRMKHGLAFALLAYWAIALLPFLKYPANPPGIGDPETIGTRQALYVGFLLLSIVGVALAVWVGRVLAQRNPGPRSVWSFTIGAMAVIGIGLLVVMPGINEEISLPVGLVHSFRALSLAGLTLFWIVMGLLFGKLLSRSTRQSLEA